MTRLYFRFRSIHKDSIWTDITRPLVWANSTRPSTQTNQLNLWSGQTRLNLRPMLIRLAHQLGLANLGRLNSVFDSGCFDFRFEPTWLDFGPNRLNLTLVLSDLTRLRPRLTRLNFGSGNLDSTFNPS